MNLLPLLIFFLLSSVSGFALVCETKTAEAKETFELSSQSLKSKISEIWTCGHTASQESYVRCIKDLNLDQYYRKYIKRLNTSEDFSAGNAFERAIKRCGSLVCNEVRNEYRNSAGNEVQMATVEIDNITDNQAVEDAGTLRFIPRERKETSSSINMESAIILLGLIAIIGTAIIIFLRVKYPLKNLEVKTTNRLGEEEIVYNPDIAISHPAARLVPV